MDLSAVTRVYLLTVSLFGLLVTSLVAASDRQHASLVPTARCDGILDVCGVCGGDGSSCQGRNGSRPGPRSAARLQEGVGQFQWRLAWTACSVSCGVGDRRRVAQCVELETNLTASPTRCRHLLEPLTDIVFPCDLRPCADTGKFQLKDDGLFRNYFGDIFNDQIPAISRFLAGDWSPCSATCGVGRKSRKVMCTSHNPFAQREDVVPDSQCFGTKPPEVEACNAGPCRGDLPNPVFGGPSTIFYKWHISGFSECSKSCMEGVQEGLLRCVSAMDERQELSPSLCSRLRKPPLIVRPCSMGPCPPRWSVGEFGPCSAACGGGRTTRDVLCVQEVAEGQVRGVDEYRCPDPAPESELLCNDVYCPALWVADPWSQCSKTCGTGAQRRRVYCVKEPVVGHRVTVSELECLGPRPSQTRQCSDTDCPDDDDGGPVIQAENYTFVQLRRAKKVKLPVGGRIRLLPGQSVTVRCPVKNFHPRLIFWSRNLKLVAMVGRVRATFSGNLKISKADPKTDAGNYTCIAGPESADVSIEFLSQKEAHQKLKDVMHYLLDEDSTSAVVVKPGEPSYQDGVVQDGGYNVTKKFVYLSEEWTPCSVTCGSGYQRRRVTCARVTNKYVKTLPDRDCERLGMERPPDINKCSTLAACPQWVLGNWSQCSVDACVRDGFAERHRKLHCAFSNGTLAPSHVCGDKMPDTKSECANEDCISHWTTSPWTHCHPSCGAVGHKARSLSCTWRKNGRPAWTACQDKPRPVVSKVCKLRPCPTPAPPESCSDNSRYCSLARMLRMCRFWDFRRNCCNSCTSYLQSTLP